MTFSSDLLFQPVDLAELKGRTVHGGFWTFGAQCGRFALTLSTTAVMARLLVPEDFGLVAMVMVVVGAAGLFRDLGLTTAIIQARTVSRQQASNIFWRILCKMSKEGLTGREESFLREEL